MSAIVSSAATMAEWQAMLDRIEESVQQALAEVARRDRAFGAEPEGPAFEAPSSGQIEERLAGLESRFARARELAGEIEGLLAQDERDVQSWRDAAATARQRLDAIDRL